MTVGGSRCKGSSLVGGEIPWEWGEKEKRDTHRTSAERIWWMDCVICRSSSSKPWNRFISILRGLNLGACCSVVPVSEPCKLCRYNGYILFLTTLAHASQQHQQLCVFALSREDHRAYSACRFRTSIRSCIYLLSTRHEILSSESRIWPWYGIQLINCTILHDWAL